MNTINDDYFVLEGSLAFDFTAKSDITIVFFLGAASNTDRHNIENQIKIIKQGLAASGRIVNAMVITDGDNPGYSCNFLGIPGICDNLEELSNLINKKLYWQGTTKRTIVIADCGGAVPAVITSSMVDYHSMFLTTPHLRVFPDARNFTMPDRIAHYGSNVHVWIAKNLLAFEGFFDCLDFLDKYINKYDTRLSINYAKTVQGSDLKMRDLLSIYKYKTNVSINDWNIPDTYSPHSLIRWMSKERLILDYLKKEIDLHTIGVTLGVAQGFEP